MRKKNGDERNENQQPSFEPSFYEGDVGYSALFAIFTSTFCFAVCYVAVL